MYADIIKGKLNQKEKRVSLVILNELGMVSRYLGVENVKFLHPLKMGT